MKVQRIIFADWLKSSEGKMGNKASLISALLRSIACRQILNSSSEISLPASLSSPQFSTFTPLIKLSS